jgi:hypothetical protein
VGLGGRRDGGAGERGCGNSGESESGKLPHENILQLFANIWTNENLCGDPERQIATLPD